MLSLAIISKREISIIKYLVEVGADLSSTSNGFTPLAVAVLSNRKEIVEYLAEKSDIEAVNTQGYTPLHLAAVKGYYMNMTTLIQHGANITALNAFEMTPIDVAKTHECRYLLVREQFRKEGAITVLKMCRSFLFGKHILPFELFFQIIEVLVTELDHDEIMLLVQKLSCRSTIGDLIGMGRFSTFKMLQYARNRNIST